MALSAGHQHRQNFASSWAHGLAWHQGDDVCEVQTIIETKPKLKPRAAALFLGTIGDGVFASLPYATVAADDAFAHIKRMFPGASLQIVRPSKMRAACETFAFHFPENETMDYAVSLPGPNESTRHICIATTDETGRYVRTAHLLHALAYYVLTSAANVHYGVECQLGGMMAKGRVIAMLTSLPRNMPDAVSAATVPKFSIGEILRVGGFFAGYVLAYYMNIEPRCMSHFILEEEYRDPHLDGLIDTFVGDIAWVVGFPPALKNFIDHHAGVTLEEWQAHPSEAFRIAVINKVSDLLMAYQAPQNGLAAFDGGREWIPPDADADLESKWFSSPEDEEALLAVARDLYRQFFDNLQHSLFQSGPPTSAICIPVFSTDDDPIVVGDMYFLGKQLARDYIGSQLANPNCLFVAMIEPTGSKQSGRQLRFVFSSHYFRAEAICPLVEAPLRLEFVPLVKSSRETTRG